MIFVVVVDHNAFITDEKNLFDWIFKTLSIERKSQPTGRKLVCASCEKLNAINAVIKLVFRDEILVVVRKV